MTSKVVTPPVENGTALKESSFDAAIYYPQNVEGTTWLKHVPWDGIHKDESKEIEQELEIYKTKSSYYDEMFVDKLKITGCDVGTCNFVAGPTVQVISVQIFREDDPYWNEFNISGDISIIDAKNNAFYVYDNVESVSSSNNTLTLRPYSFAPVMWGNVKFNLMKEGLVQIFDIESVVEYRIDDDSKTKRFDGKYGFYALMIFSIIPYASIARVRMNIYDADHDIPGSGPFGVYGTIKAKSTNVHGERKYIEVVCFDKKRSEPVNMSHGRGINNYIEMSTHVFAVSVFSQLLFDLSLWLSDGTKLAVDEIDGVLDPGERIISSQEYYCDNENFKLHVYIEWFIPIQFFANKEFDCEDMRVEWSRGKCRQIEQSTKTNLPLVDDHNLEMSHFPLVAQIAKPPPAGCQLVEVFSIFVEGSSPYIFLSGSIVIKHRDETLYIFSRNKNLPDKLLSNKQGFRKCISLAWSDNSWVEEKKFYMHLKLRDDKDNEICRGSLQWSCGFDPFQHDRRLCEIILGRDGYFAAVHYSIFTNGLRAKLTVQCCSVYANENNCISVYGSVYAEYSNHRYHSTYDKEYYRSIIFKRSGEDRIFVENCSELPLSKSRICAPSNCEELIVDFDLVVEVHPVSLYPASLKSSCSCQGNGHAISRIHFKAKTNAVREIHNNKCGEKIGEGRGCEGCCIKVTVDWF